MQVSLLHASSRGSGFAAWFNWGITTFFCLFQFFLQASASVMTAAWEKDFGLDAMGVSGLSAAFFYSYLLMQIPVGFLNDHFSTKGILTFGAFLVAWGCALLAYTHSIHAAYCGRILMGIGSSFGFVSMLYVCSRWFALEHFSLMVGISEAIGMVGVALITVFSAWLLPHVGWRGILYGCVTTAALIMLGAHVFMQDKNKKATCITLKSLWSSLSSVLKQRNVWIASIYGFFGFTLVDVITSLWGVPFLHTVYHLSISVSAAISSMILYGLAIGTPLFGWLSHIMGRHKPLLLFGASSTTLILSIVIFVPHLSEGVLFTLFFLTGILGSAYIQCFTISKEATAPHTHGVSLAVTNTIIMLGAPIIQVFIGYLLSHHFSYRLAMGIVPAGIALSFFVALGLRETKTIIS